MKFVSALVFVESAGNRGVGCHCERDVDFGIPTNVMIDEAIFGRIHSLYRQALVF